MDVEPSIAFLGALIAVPARANILSALFDGRALTATELAYAARVTPQTTSSHLAKLVEARLITVERQGRHRYYRLAGPQIADALEPLTLISPHSPFRQGSTQLTCRSFVRLVSVTTTSRVV
jgi:DNA-binding transcriptional ArsR family regulator